jgi:hypothetical protein
LNKGPQKSNCGSYLAKVICKQAKHVLAYPEIPKLKCGNHTNHPSLLNNTEIQEAVFKWAAAQIPDEVS